MMIAISPISSNKPTIIFLIFFILQNDKSDKWHQSDQLPPSTLTGIVETPRRDSETDPILQARR